VELAFHEGFRGLLLRNIVDLETCIADLDGSFPRSCFFVSSLSASAAHSACSAVRPFSSFSGRKIDRKRNVHPALMLQLVVWFVVNRKNDFGVLISQERQRQLRYERSYPVLPKRSGIPQPVRGAEAVFLCHSNHHDGPTKLYSFPQWTLFPSLLADCTKHSK